MCEMFPNNAGESNESGTMLSTLAERELGAVMDHMEQMLHSGNEADAFGHFLMMLTALRALKSELI